MLPPMRPLPLSLALTLLAAAAQAAPAAAPAPAQDPEARYQALLAAAKAGGADVDWQGLRVAYALRPSFKVFAQPSAKRVMFQAAGDCSKALPAAEAVIEERFVDIDAHMIAAYCHDIAAQADVAKRERDIGVGLVKSIETGDGLSPAQAFTVIDVDEEYSVMRALGLKVSAQALIQTGGHSYDALTTTDEKGQKATYYFLIDRILAAESAALAPGAVSEGGPPN
jgi:hypothetical protein